LTHYKVIYPRLSKPHGGSIISINANALDGEKAFMESIAAGKGTAFHTLLYNFKIADSDANFEIDGFNHNPTSYYSSLPQQIEINSNKMKAPSVESNVSASITNNML
jgi:hypothetical protein